MNTCWRCGVYLATEPDGQCKKCHSVFGNGNNSDILAGAWKKTAFDFRTIISDTLATALDGLNNHENSGAMIHALATIVTRLQDEGFSPSVKDKE